MGFDDDEETMEEYVRRRAYADSFGVGGHDRILAGDGYGDGGGGGGVIRPRGFDSIRPRAEGEEEERRGADGRRRSGV